MYYYT